MDDNKALCVVVGVIATTVLILALGLTFIVGGNNTRDLEAAGKAGLQQCQVAGSSAMIWQRECPK